MTMASVVELKRSRRNLRTMTQALQRHEELLQAGSEALARAAWVEARVAFEIAIAERESPEALLGLRVAAGALFDTNATLRAHERGYQLASDAGERRAAARFALELALDCLSFRGPAEARGWL